MVLPSPRRGAIACRPPSRDHALDFLELLQMIVRTHARAESGPGSRSHSRLAATSPLAAAALVRAFRQRPDVAASAAALLVSLVVVLAILA